VNQLNSLDVDSYILAAGEEGDGIFFLCFLPMMLYLFWFSVWLCSHSKCTLQQ